MQEKNLGHLTHGMLFTGFFQAGIIGFGGVLPVARRLIVDERKWLTQAAFNDLLSLCQFMPGANIVNFAFAFGARHRGLSGAAAAVLGLLGAPVCIVMTLGAVYARYGQLPAARHGSPGWRPRRPNSCSALRSRSPHRCFPGRRIFWSRSRCSRWCCCCACPCR